MSSLEAKAKPAISIDEQTCQDLVFTLAICRKYLPESVDPVHFIRLRRIERIIQDYFAQFSKEEMKPHG